MGLQFENLDSATRALMLEEIDRDMSGRGLYTSSYLNDQGAARWPTLLRNAAAEGSDDTLAVALNAEHCFKQQVERRKKNGGYSMVAVPYTAAQTLAESQFNMYYMRALSRRAIDEDLSVTIYRAKEVQRPREESERLIGTQIDPQIVLESLRETLGVEPSIGIPLPNSGLTITLGKP